MKLSKILHIVSVSIVLSLVAVAIVTIPVRAASIVVTPTQGPPGTTVTVTGESFIPGEVLEVDFPQYQSKAYATVSPAGTFTATFKVPEKTPGIYQVQIWRLGSGTSSLVTQTDFTVNSSSAITINPQQGPVGSEIVINGTGFGDDETVAIKFDGTAVNVRTGDYRTDDNGDFRNTVIAVPKSVAGSHAITVSGDTSQLNATADFVIKSSIAVSPSSGPPGTKATITGDGFSYQKTATVFVNQTEVASATIGSNGSFVTTFTVPPGLSGPIDVRAQDENGNQGATKFTVSAAISVSPSSGNTGGTVTITGSGFKVSSPIAISYDNSQKTNAVTDGNGNFSVNFTVPPSAKGSHNITVSDSTNSASAAYVVVTSASLNQTSGNVGTQLIVTGSGFTGAVVIKYDTQEVATVSADSTGAFSATFKVPVSKHGAHSVVIAGSAVVNIPFTVDSTPLPAPALLLPTENSKTGSEAQFDWSDATAPSLPVTYILQIATSQDFAPASLVLEKAGVTKSAYTLAKEEKLKSVKQEAPYYWRVKVVDAASNESVWSAAQSFYTGSIFSIPSMPSGGGSVVIVVGGLAIAAALVAVGYLLGKHAAYRL